MYFLPTFVIFSIALYVFLATSYVNNKIQLSTRELVQLDLMEKSIIRDFQLILPDIEILLNSSELVDFAKQSDIQNRTELVQEWLEFLSYKHIYDQMRFLDLGGKEVVRVNYNKGNSYETPITLLQDKSNRYYFSETLALKPKQIYVSPIDLNMERGEIERPLKPMIRFGALVHDDKGDKLGLFIINYRAKDLLSHLDKVFTDSRSQIALVNTEGYYIRSELREHEWGQQLGHEWTFQKTYPEAWKIIQSNIRGQFLNNDGLFTYTTVAPLSQSSRNSEYRITTGYYWKIISRVTPDILMSPIKMHLFGPTGFIALIACFVILLGSWGLARIAYNRRLLLNQLLLHANVYNSATDGIMITDPEFKILSINQAFTTITGYSSDEIIGKTPDILKSDRHNSHGYEEMWNTLRQQGQWQGETWNRQKNGSVFAEWLRISAITDGKNQVLYYVGLFSDITAQKLSELALHERAHHDALTGLLNRLAFHDRLEQALAFADRNKTHVALLYIDLDRFKPINDQYGHSVGDSVLIEVARRLHEAIRDSEAIARMGGDEFAALVTGYNARENANHVATRILQSLSRPIIVDGMQFNVGASIGISVYRENADNLKDLLEQADMAMYQVKRTSGHGLKFFGKNDASIFVITDA